MIKRPLLILAILSLFFTSCSREWKIRHKKEKIAKLAIQYPELLKLDSLNDTDSNFQKEIAILDSVNADSLGEKPIVIPTDKKGGYTKFWKKDKKIYHETFVPADTTVKTEKHFFQTIHVDKPEPKPTIWQKIAYFFKSIMYWIIGAVVLIIIILIRRI